jgi:hypothetical protein
MAKYGLVTGFFVTYAYNSQAIFLGLFIGMKICDDDRIGFKFEHQMVFKPVFEYLTRCIVRVTMRCDD